MPPRGKKRSNNYQDGGQNKKRRQLYGKKKTGYIDPFMIKGPGIFVTCVRGKEARAVSEMYGLLNEYADLIYPKVSTSQPPLAGPSGQVPDQHDEDDQDDDEDPDFPRPAKLPVVDLADDEEEVDGGMDIESLMRKELHEMKKPKAEWRFRSVKTGTDCLAFISCAPPYDPVTLVHAIVEGSLDKTSKGAQAAGQSRYILRLFPVVDTCHCLSEKDVDGLIRRVVKNGFARKWDLERLQRNDGEVPVQSEEESENLITYRTDPTLRSHNKPLTRMSLIQSAAAAVAELHMHAITEMSSFSEHAIVKEVTVDGATAEVSQPIPSSETSDPQGTKPTAEIILPERDVVEEKETEPAKTEMLIKEDLSIDPIWRQRPRVNLDDPSHLILINVHKNVCGVSVVDGNLYGGSGHKFNLNELGGEGRKKGAGPQDHDDAIGGGEVKPAEATEEAGDGVPGYDVMADVAVATDVKMDTAEDAVNAEGMSEVQNLSIPLSVSNSSDVNL